MLAAALEAADALPQDAWLSLNVAPSVILTSPQLPVDSWPAGRAGSIIEITEHAEIDDYAAVRTALAGLGPTVGLAVDDAGAGFASLRHIVELAPRFLKLDLSLVRHVDLDLARQAMIAGLCHFADRAGCEVIAEGIEDSAELDMLHAAWGPARAGLSSRATDSNPPEEGRDLKTPRLATVAVDPARLVRAALGLRPTQDGRTRPTAAGLPLTVREELLSRAGTRRRLRAATGLAGITACAALRRMNAVGMALLFPERQVSGARDQWNRAAVALIVTIIAFGRRRLPPLPLAIALACSMILLGLLPSCSSRRVGTTSLMLLAVLPPAVAVSALERCSPVGLAAGRSVGTRGPDRVRRRCRRPGSCWVGGWLVLTISGLASLVGCVGAPVCDGGRSSTRWRRVALTSGRSPARLSSNASTASSPAATRTDPLTGLGNRLRLNDELAAASHGQADTGTIASSRSSTSIASRPITTRSGTSQATLRSAPWRPSSRGACAPPTPSAASAAKSSSSSCRSSPSRAAVGRPNGSGVRSNGFSSSIRRRTDLTF